MTLALYGALSSSSVFSFGRGLVAVDQRRQAQAQLEGGVRAQHVAGVLQFRKAVDAGDAQRRPPGAVEQRLDRVGGGRQRRPAVGAAGPREALPDLVAEDLRGRPAPARCARPGSRSGSSRAAGGRSSSPRAGRAPGAGCGSSTAPGRSRRPNARLRSRISTFSVPLTMPRRLVVSHSWS